MNIRDIEKRIREIEKNNKEYAKDILNERELVKKLKEKDPSWSLFINRIRNTYEIEKNRNEWRTYLRLKEERSDINFFANIKDTLDSLPESNGSKYFPKIEKNVAIIADEFLFDSFFGVTNLYYINSDNYMDNAEKMDILIVASTWRGIDNEWRGSATPNSAIRLKLIEVIKYYRDHDIPVVFYNKEDPVNFDRFIEIAKHCDFVFTTASEKIPDYEKICGHSNVHLIEFSANPLYHNPLGINLYRNENAVLFAGSWYAKYPNRQQDTIMMFDGILESDKELKILDRNFNLNLEEYSFPAKYLKYISPPIPHKYVQKLHKLYGWSVNLNSVITSPTMISNRVFELQALGTNILSNYSPAINNRFTNVFIITNKFEIDSILNNFSKEESYEHQMKGIRNIFSRDTSYHRLEYIFNIVGINYKAPKRKILVVGDRLDDNTTKSFERQQFENKKLIKREDFNNEIKSQFDFVTFFKEDIFYDANYLSDLVNGFIYTNSEFVTKSDLFQKESFTYTNTNNDKYKTLFWSNSYSFDELMNTSQMRSLLGLKIDHLEYEPLDTNRNKKTLNLDKQYKVSVIIPIYNNGKYLENKCFQSLKRSSIFEDMEIVLVDDGSTDDETKMIIEKLNNKYPNVKTFYFNDNGSGSASRPRNKGVEIATSEYITYLDPDNEAINDGYSVLYNEIIQDQSIDLVVGNIKRCDTKVVRLNYFNSAYKYSEDGIINNPQDLLRKTSLKAQSIQALLVRKKVIEENNIKMVEGAAGQDTLFFQELLMNSQKIKVIDLDIHVYYANVASSVTNTITKKFFEKYLKLEKVRIKFLEENNLLDIYMAERFNYYFVNWYLKRVPLIKNDSLEESLNVLYTIFKLYEPLIVNADPIIKRFKKNMESNQLLEFKDYCIDFFSKAN